ncbi:hypothetical protein BDV09DRAFT_173727 [Aspergillus tetrazonus]
MAQQPSLSLQFLTNTLCFAFKRQLNSTRQLRNCTIHKSLKNIRLHRHVSSGSFPTMDTSIDPSYLKLFQAVESRFAQATSIPADKWAILATSTLAAGPEPERADQLYLYLTSQPAYSTSDARKQLVRRLREALLKSVIIVGVCKPIEAILAISKVEKEEDKDYSSATREGWACDEANHERGVTWFNKLYARNGNATLDLFAAHKDFSWLSMEITYGLFLSDRQVLDDVDTQMVVLPGIMSQNLPNETHWHIRGTRRLGVPIEDVKIVTECVKIVADFYGKKLDKVPSVDDVEKDV